MATGAFHTVPPEAVRVLYNKAGVSHVFTSPDLPGLHIGHPDLRAAFDVIARAVGGLVAADYGVEAEYTCDLSFDEFRRLIEPKGEVLDLQQFLPALTLVRGDHGGARAA